MDATYPLGRVSYAAECPIGVLGRWLETGVIEMRAGDVDSPHQGIPRQFSVPRVLQIAAVRALNSLGVSPLRAASASLPWTDQGTAGLAAGEVFDDGYTFLAIDDGGARVVNFPADVGLAQAIQTGAGWNPRATIFLDLRRLRERVLDRLAEIAPTNPNRYETK